MKHIKTYENLFYKKPQINFELDTKYLYNDPFYDEDIVYVCTNCHSYKLTKIEKRGFQPPEFKCENCGKMNYAPDNMTPDEYKKMYNL